MIKERVLAIIFEVTLYGILEEITLDLSFKDDMDLSQDKVYEILESVEEEYNVEIVDLVNEIDSGKQIVEFIEEHLNYED